MSSHHAIEPAWFARPATEVAPDAIGCTLVRKTNDGQILRGLIVETEAYEPGDPACHGYRKKSDRNAAMFGPPGMIYVYLIYGMYHCVNLSTDAEGVASAILIRALQLDAVPPAIDRAKVGKVDRIAAGPGKLCRVLEIDRSLTGESLTFEGALWCEPRHPKFQEELDAGKQAIVQTTRIGISKGVDLPWRWYLADCAAVSRR
ncbi:MAG: DNA-3-methyladenine glycosylase [Cyanobacteriota bacterium]|nr:DNA-3-methyladenine glycosylase [Cyanobacteriota bacterium]